MKKYMSKRLLPAVVALALAAPGIAPAANFNPIAITGYNAGMIVPQGACTNFFNNYTTASGDNGFLNTGTTFFEQGFFQGRTNEFLGAPSGFANYTNGLITLQTGGVPAHGSTFSSVDGSGPVFTMAPDYTKNCAFLAVSNTVSANSPATNCPSVTITLTQPAPYTAISLLNSSGNGGANSQVIIGFSDGSTQSVVVEFWDWFSAPTAPSGYAWFLNGRITTTSGGLGNYGIAETNPNLHHTDITLNNTTANVTSITYSVPGTSAKEFVFAVSGQTGGSWVPVPVAGYNCDPIVEATATHNDDYLNTVNVSIDNGLYVEGNTFFEQGFYISSAADMTYGVPQHGTTFATYTNANILFTMAPDYRTNCVFFCDSMVPTVSMVLANQTTAYNYLDVLVSSGGAAIQYNIAHADGNSDTGTINVPNWFASTTNVAWVPKGRMQPENITMNNIGSGVGNSQMFYFPLPMIDTNSAVTNVSFTYQSGGGHTMFFALSGSQNGTNFAPITVSGWNADGIVEASVNAALSNKFAPYNALGIYAGLWPVTLADTTATTATFDNGIFNYANVFFEQGGDRLWPLSGIPHAGSTITSLALPDHQYTFAPNYVNANDVVYLDRTNVPTATITPVTPAAYTAMSFLGSAANGGTTNSVVVQHLDGSIENATFYIPDWFTTTIAGAYDCQGRASINQNLFNNEPGATAASSGTPRLFESQIILTNITSPVTNIILSYLASTTVGNSNSARTCVLAVSGSVNPVKPFFNAGNVTPNAFVGYEGTNFTLAATLGGATPTGLGYQWYKSPTGAAGSWVAIANGGEYSGATSLTLGVTGATFANDNGYFELVAANTAGTGTSAVVQVTLFSPLPNMLSPSDLPLAYQPNGGSSPSAEGVTHICDGTVGADPGKYLNFGGGGGQPFIGPVGFTDTPVKGASVISIARLFIANDTPGRDPNDMEIDGSNDGGNTWTPILADTLTPNTAGVVRYAGTSAACNPIIPPSSTLYQPCYEIRFTNTIAYTSYRVIWNHCQGGDANNNSIQVGELQLLGQVTGTPPLASLEPASSITAYVGQSPVVHFVATGNPQPITYQWYVSTTGPNGTFSAISGATGSALTLTNVQLSMNNNVYECKASNALGTTPSTTTTLTVVPAPTGGYELTILADGPIAYLPLNESPDNFQGDQGTPAIDYVGGNNGYYTNDIIAQPGYSTNDPTAYSCLFGEYNGLGTTYNSYVGGIAGPSINFGTASNFNTAFSIEAWAMGDPNVGPTELANAVIVNKGYGGGEQFVIDTGTGTGFRFGFRDGIVPAGTAAPTIHYATSTATNTVDGKWHHLVGVLDEVNSNQLFYVDGSLVASNNLGTSGLGVINNGTSDAYPIGIGSGTAINGGTYTNQFIGWIDQVAIYNKALAASNILAHYDAAGEAPYFSVQPVTNADVSSGANYTLTTVAVGTLPITYQWSVEAAGGGVFVPVSGATNETLTLTNVTSAMNGNQYSVVASNKYGTATSGIGVITVIAGKPEFIVNLPASEVAYPGSSLSIGASVDGSLPITYTWQFISGTTTTLSDGGQISGSATATVSIGNVGSANAGGYQLIASNTFGAVTSSVCTVTVLPSVITFANTAAYTLNGNAALTPGDLNVTTPVGSLDSSAWFNTPVYVGDFIATFEYYNATGAGGADGACFAIQNDPRGLAALGGGGGTLGISGVEPSVEFEFNIYSGNTVGGIGCCFAENGGNSPTFVPGNVSIIAGDPIYTTIKYVNNNVTVTLVDSNALTSFTTNYPNVNIPALVGATTAYIGFTGSDGGVSAQQDILNFSYTPLVKLGSQVSAGNYVFSWPAGSGHYVLQQSTSVNSGWANSSATVTEAGGVNTVTVPIGTGNVYFRLNLE